MGNFVQSYNQSKKALFAYFKCDDDFFVKNLVDFHWQVTEEDGIYFLSYWNNNSDKTLAVIVKKNDVPQIYEANNHTMIIAIDCVKIAFIFDSGLRV